MREPRVHIGEVLRNAFVFNFKNAQRCEVDEVALIKTVARLFALLEERGADCVLVGGVALLQYVAGRNTEDIDLILDAASLRRVPEIQVQTEDENFARATFAEIRIDILKTVHPLFERVRKSYSTVRKFQERDIRCATVEGLLVLKLYSLPSLYRQGQLERAAVYESDVASLLYRHPTNMEPLFAELRPHLLGSDLSEVKKIVDEIRQREGRFK